MTYFQKAVEGIIEDLCPAEKLGENFPDMDANSYTSPLFETGERGCRGITCEQCWNQEIMKPLDK